MSEIEERNNIRDKEGFINCKVCAKKYFSSLAFKVHLKFEHGSIQQLEKRKPTPFQDNVAFLIKEEKQCQVTESLHHEELVNPNDLKIEEDIFPKNVLEICQEKVLPMESRSQEFAKIVDKIDELKSTLQRQDQSDFQASLQKCNQDVHAKFKQFHCKKCQKKFSRKDRLKIHFQSVHENLKSFQCLECNRPFNRIDHLQKHGKIFHGLKKRFQ